jgi:hypothetical protein
VIVPLGGLLAVGAGVLAGGPGAVGTGATIDDVGDAVGPEDGSTTMTIDEVDAAAVGAVDATGVGAGDGDVGRGRLIEEALPG